MIPGKNQPTYVRITGKDGMIHTAMIGLPSLVKVPGGSMGIFGNSCAGEYREKNLQQVITRIHLLNSIACHDINNQLTVSNGYLSLIE